MIKATHAPNTHIPQFQPEGVENFRRAHGLRNEMDIPSEVALERALLHSKHLHRGGTSLPLKAEETM